MQLSAAATPEMIKTRGYDSVLVAIGTEPVIPKIPGSDGSNVWNTVSVMGKEKSLGKNVVFVGGGEWGTESAMGLAKLGHKVTIVSSDKLPEVSSIFLCGTGRDAAVLISESVRRSHRYSKSNTHREKH